MRLPGYLLRDAVTIRSKGGSSAYGPVLGNEVSENWQLQPGFKKVTNARGEEEVASLDGIGPADSIAKPGDSLIYGGRFYEFIDVQAVRMDGAVHHVEGALRSKGAAV
jgi:hypothetical protein